MATKAQSSSEDRKLQEGSRKEGNKQEGNNMNKQNGRQSIIDHLEQTKKHVQRLEKVFERLGIQKEGEEKCAAMEGLIEESKKIVQEFQRGPVRDAALIIGCQKIEHYEIASYGSLYELADVLEEERIGDLLGRTLQEEEDDDELLSQIAQDVNDQAAELSMQEEEDYR